MALVNTKYTFNDILRLDQNNFKPILNIIFIDAYSGNVGLAITQSIGLIGLFQWGMRRSVELANQMASVERVLEYTVLPQEPALKSPQSNSD